jgi:hypothetical protein
VYTSVFVWVGWEHKPTRAHWPFHDILCLSIWFIPPVVQYLWQSTVSYITKSYHSRLVQWKCFPKRRNLNSARRPLVVHISLIRSGELAQTTSRAPCGWKPYVRRGAALCLEGIVYDTAITTSVSYSLRHDSCHTLALVDQSPVYRPRTLPPPRRGRQGLSFGRESARLEIPAVSNSSFGWNDQTQIPLSASSPLGRYYSNGEEYDHVHYTVFRRQEKKKRTSATHQVAVIYL